MGRHLGNQGSARSSSALDSLEIQSHSKCLLPLLPLVLKTEPNYATFRNTYFYSFYLGSIPDGCRIFPPGLICLLPCRKRLILFRKFIDIKITSNFKNNLTVNLHSVSRVRFRDMKISRMVSVCLKNRAFFRKFLQLAASL